MSRFVEGDTIRTELEEDSHLDLYNRLKGKENSQVKHFKMA
jgi:hypothetical protein